MAHVKPEYAPIGREFEVEILGERFPAKEIAESPWDPENERLRA